MTDYEYDEDEAPGAPYVNIGAELRLTMPELDLTAQVGGQTLADLICRQALDKLVRSDPWNSLTKRVQDITADEIRARVAELIAEALNGDLRRTNSYGEAQGEPTTLRTLIAEEAKRFLTQMTDNYRGPRETVIGKLVREEVEKSLKTELADAIKEERTKVVAAVRKQAAQLIAEAVTAGVGQPTR